MEKRRELIGVVGVDSGQLILCDPCYIDNQYIKRSDGEFNLQPIWKHKGDGSLWQFCFGGKPNIEGVKAFPGKFNTKIPKYKKSPNDLIEEEIFVDSGIDPMSHIPDSEFSYPGISKATSNDKTQSGQLNYLLGHPGVAVAFRTGLGDGVYNVYAEYANIPGWGERITSVTVEFLSEDELEDIENEDDDER